LLSKGEPLPIVRAVFNFIQNKDALSFPPSLLPPAWDDEKGLSAYVITPEKLLNDLVLQRLQGNPLLNQDKLPIPIDLRAHLLKFQGDFRFPLAVNGKPRETHLMVIADEVDLADARFFLEGGSQLIIVTHRAIAPPRPGAREAAVPLVGLSGPASFNLYVSDPLSPPRLFHFVGDPPNSRMATHRPGEKPWDPFMLSPLPGVSKKFGDFWTEVHEALIARFLKPNDLDEKAQAIILQDVLAIPRVLVGRDEKDIDAQLHGYVEKLFASKLVVLTDGGAAARIPCLSRIKNGRLVFHLLPDTLEIEPFDGKLGRVYIQGDGSCRFTFTVRPALSEYARVRGGRLIRERYPDASIEELPLHRYRLRWPAKPQVAHLPLASDGSGVAWDASQSATTFTIGPLDSTGLAAFVRYLSSGRFMATQGGLRLGLEDLQAKAPTAIGEYTLVLDFGNLALPSGKLGAKSGVQVEFDAAEGSHRKMTVTNNTPFAVEVTRVFSEFGPAALDGAAPRVDAQGQREFEVVTAVAPKAKLSPEWRLDLAGQSPFAVFSLGPMINIRTMEVKLGGLYSARFPDEQGHAGAGRYIDPARSTLAVFYQDAGGKQEFPGPVLTLDQLRLLYGKRYDYPVFGSYSSKVVLKLYRRDEPDSDPTVLSLPLPYSDNGVEIQSRDLDRRTVEPLLSQALPGKP
jgi:hypothetical protein